MKIFIKAKPKSKTEFVKKTDDTHYTVAVHEPPIHNRANQAIIESLADYFHKPKSQIFIVSGETSKQKIVEVPINIEELKNMDVQRKMF